MIADQTHLIEEDVLAISALGCKLLQVPILADAVLEAQLLPELAANCRLVLAESAGMYGYWRGVWWCGAVLMEEAWRGTQHTVVAALAGLDGDDFPVISHNLSIDRVYITGNMLTSASSSDGAEWMEIRWSNA